MVQTCQGYILTATSIACPCEDPIQRATEVTAPPKPRPSSSHTTCSRCWCFIRLTWMRPRDWLGGAGLPLTAKPDAKPPAGRSVAAAARLVLPRSPRCTTSLGGCWNQSTSWSLETRRYFCFPGPALAVCDCDNTRPVLQNQKCGLQVDKDMQGLAQQHRRQPSDSKA